MSRIRTIKPEFWTSEQVMECSPLARLAFIGMWNFCDDQGVHPAAFKTLKAQVFPADDLSVQQVATLIAELIKHRLVTEFESGGKLWWFVTGWHHQLIKNPSAPKYPKPPKTTPVLPQSYPSPTPGGEPGEEEEEEGKGKEGKGEEEEERETTLSARDLCATDSQSPSSSSPDGLITIWNEVNPDRAVQSIPPKRRNAIHETLAFIDTHIGKPDWPRDGNDVLPWFAEIFRYARGHDGYLRERDFGFFVNPDRLAGVVEGSYEPRH
jgi:hypothetical protein